MLPLTAANNQINLHLICCKTIIGKGSPNKAGTSGVHGAALGEEEVLLTRKNINWNFEPFEIPEEAYAGWNQEDAGKENMKVMGRNWLKVIKKNLLKNFLCLIVWSKENSCKNLILF